MDNSHTATLTLNRSRLPIAQIILIGCALATASACGMVDYDYKKNQFADSAKKERSLGVIHFRYAGESEEPYDVTVKRVRHGYAMTAPMYDGDSTHVNFTVSHDSESGNFLGLRSNWEF